MRRSCLSSLGRMDLSAQSVGGMAATGFINVGGIVCEQCHRQSSVTVGTVLHHTHIGLYDAHFGVPSSKGKRGGGTR